MKGLQEQAITDIFALANSKYRSEKPEFFLSFFEIYGGRAYDLLNDRNKLAVMEDHN